MKYLFLEARHKGIIELTTEAMHALPQRVVLAATVQFVSSLGKARKQLEAMGKKVYLLKGIHSKYPGQVLGCDILHACRIPKADCVLFIGTGNFHPKALAYKMQKPVFVYEPYGKTMRVINEEDIADFDKAKNRGLALFYSSMNIGIIATVKPGQKADKKSIAVLRSRHKGKSFYSFVADTIDYRMLNNFNFIDCWVNTACPRIAYDDHAGLDKPIINISDIL